MSICFECGELADHLHHVVPRSKGGNATVPLCVICHGKVHDRDMAGVALTSDGLRRVKDSGVRLGRPSQMPASVKEQVVRLRAKGLTFRRIAETLTREGVPTVRGGRWWPSTVAAVLKTVELDHYAEERR